MAGYSSLEILAIQQAYESMLRDIQPFIYVSNQVELIDKAYRYCLEKYDGWYMLSGKAYMMHLIEMGRIAVLEVGLGYISVVAAFLHGIDYKKGVSGKELKDQFGKTVAIILEDFSQISQLDTERWPTIRITSRCCSFL